MLSRLSTYLDNFSLNRLLQRSDLLDRFFSTQRNKIVDAVYTYPSFINTGYLHFEKLFEIASDYGLLEKEGLILDVGGADGVTAVKLNEAFKNSRVFVFEPLQDNISELNKNTSGHKRITLFEMALGSEKKQGTINITKRITSSSLLSIKTTELKDDYMSSQLVPQRSQVIEVNTADNIVKPGETVLVIKIDVQGFELEVLKGAERTLKNTILVMAEFQNHHLYDGAPMYYQVDEFLRNHNFTLLQNIPSLREKHKQLEWDGIYINNSFL